jgi:hypothetical protein
VTEYDETTSRGGTPMKGRAAVLEEPGKAA